MKILHVVMVMVLGFRVHSGDALAQEADDGWPRLTFVYETGPTYVVQNDGQYGEGGTRYDADDVGQQDNLVRTWRNSLELAGGRHTVILLYAPFELRTQATLPRDVQFRGARFAAGTVVDHRYLFEGYRGSYLYRVLDRPRLALELGATVQIRNAEVAFTAVDGSQRADEDDIGVVGAAKLRLWWQPGAAWPWAGLEADGFSTFGMFSDTEGSIYDVQLTLGRPIARGVDFFLGARLYGGGAEVEAQQIYNRANFLSFTIGARIAPADLVGRRRPH
jgi:hypothetical protein